MIVVAVCFKQSYVSSFVVSNFKPSSGLQAYRQMLEMSNLPKTIGQTGF